MKRFKNKIAVVTGAGSGIGRALANRLYLEGARLALCDIDPDGLRETVRLINPSEGTVQCYTVDIADRDQVYRFADLVIHDWGQIDILVNNAGVSSSGSVMELTYPTLEWTFNINFWGVVYGTKAFLPHLTKRPEANIVNISSVFGLLGIPGQSAYCASKFAVRGFTEALRQECYNSHTTVTAVFPGGVQTNIARNSRSDLRVSPEELKEGIRRFKATFKTTADEAARKIIDGIKNKSPRVLIGRDAKKTDLLSRYQPNTYDRIVAKIAASRADRTKSTP